MATSYSPMAITRDDIARAINLMLGGGKVNVELTKDHFQLAIDLAINKYRMLSNNSLVEKVASMSLMPYKQEYQMPDEVAIVKKVSRLGATGAIAGAATLDPFSIAFMNQYVLNSGGGSGGLLTFYLYASYTELVGKLFGREINHIYNATSKVLFIDRRILIEEPALLLVYCHKTEDEILGDFMSKSWIQDYATARCKIMLGEVRSKFGSIVGGMGANTMNGAELKTEGTAELEKLENDLIMLRDSSRGFGFVVG